MNIPDKCLAAVQREVFLHEGEHVYMVACCPDAATIVTVHPANEAVSKMANIIDDAVLTMEHVKL